MNPTLVGSTRSGDIVRDADILHLYKRAGVIRFLLGIESHNKTTLEQIKKGVTISEDREAIRLLRQHEMLSMAAYVVGFEEESDKDQSSATLQFAVYAERVAGEGKAPSTVGASPRRALATRPSLATRRQKLKIAV